MIKAKIIHTPLGNMLGGFSDKGLVFLHFMNDISADKLIIKIRKKIKSEIVIGTHSDFEKLEKQLSEYFSGRRQVFDIECDMRGTDFQKRAWNILCGIPYGETISYQQQAEMLGNPKAVRAAAAANGANHIPILIPCHRVIGKNGKLTGYAGGINKKRFLLNLEQQNKL